MNLNVDRQPNGSGPVEAFLARDVIGWSCVPGQRHWESFDESALLSRQRGC